MQSFRFTPKTDAEIHSLQNQGLLSDGVYVFTVKEVTQTVSQSNNPMLKIRLSVLESTGTYRSIEDYLLATDTMIYKLKHFCDATGLENEYAQGNIEPNKIMNRSGLVKIGTQKGKPKPDGAGSFPDRNSVKDYIKDESAQKISVDNAPPFNEDINF